MISLNITTFTFVKIIEIFEIDNITSKNNNVIEMLEIFEINETFKLDDIFEIVENIIIAINITIMNTTIILLKTRLI